MADVLTPEPDPEPTRSRSKKLVKWSFGLVIAFLAFAPPGTMIVIVLVISKVLGASWLVVAGLLALGVCVSVFVILRRRRRSAEVGSGISK